MKARKAPPNRAVSILPAAWVNTFVGLVGLSGLLWTGVPVQAGDLVFIVNRQNPVVSIDSRNLVDYYEKKKKTWPNGEPIRFIDRNPGSPEREKFLAGVLKESESDVDLFWFGQKIHEGVSVPIQVASDTMMMEMVKSFKGAIGYVSSGTTLENGVKRVRISNDLR